MFVPLQNYAKKLKSQNFRPGNVFGVFEILISAKREMRYYAGERDQPMQTEVLPDLFCFFLTNMPDPFVNILCFA